MQEEGSTRSGRLAMPLLALPWNKHTVLSPDIPLARLSPMAKSKVSGAEEWKLCSSDPPLKVYMLLPQPLGVSTAGSQLSIHGNHLI